MTDLFSANCHGIASTCMNIWGRETCFTTFLARMQNQPSLRLKKFKTHYTLWCHTYIAFWYTTYIVGSTLRASKQFVFFHSIGGCFCTVHNIWLFASWFHKLGFKHNALLEAASELYYCGSRGIVVFYKTNLFSLSQVQSFLLVVEKMSLLRQSCLAWQRKQQVHDCMI